MYISVWHTVCLMVNLATLELDIFSNREPSLHLHIQCRRMGGEEAVTNSRAELSCICFCLPWQLLFTVCSGMGGRQKFFKQGPNLISAILHISHHAIQGLHHVCQPYPHPWPYHWGQMWIQFTENMLSFR